MVRRRQKGRTAAFDPQGVPTPTQTEAWATPTGTPLFCVLASLLFMQAITYSLKANSNCERSRLCRVGIPPLVM